MTEQQAERLIKLAGIIAAHMGSLVVCAATILPKEHEQQAGELVQGTIDLLRQIVLLTHQDQQ